MTQQLPRAVYPPPPSALIEPRNGMGIAAIVLGVVGALFGLLPLAGFASIVLGIVGVVLAFAGLVRLRRGSATNRNTTWAGLVASVASIALGVWGLTVVFGAVEQLAEDLEGVVDNSTAQVVDLQPQKAKSGGQG